MSQTPLADELGRISRDEFARYLQEFRPVEQQTINSLGEASVGKAMDASQGDAIRSRASLERMRERYGTALIPSAAQGETRRSNLAGVTGALTVGNMAGDFDRDNKRQTLAGLMNVGQQVRQQALGGFGSAAGMEGTRASTNSANRAAYTAQKSQQQSQMTSSAASLAAMAMFAM